MKKHSLFNTLKYAAVCLVIFSHNTEAALVDHGTFITDTTSNLDWLKLGATINRAYSDISANLGSGQEFDGWQYATQTQFVDLLWNNNIRPYFSTDGIDTLFTDGQLKTSTNLTVYDFIELFGNIDPFVTSCRPCRRSAGLLSDFGNGNYGAAVLFAGYDVSYEDMALGYRLNPTGQMLSINLYGAAPYTNAYGSYLVRPSEVPIPGAAWLFTSGLILLSRKSRKESKTTD